MRAALDEATHRATPEVTLSAARRDAPTVLAGRYRLRTLIGRGGMGRVWLARDELLHRDVAVKEAVPPVDASPAELAALRLRVTVEAQAAAQVRHPAVVQIHDLLQWPDRSS